MNNDQKTKITSDNYNQLFTEEKKSGFTNILFLVVLISVLAGMFGYFIGDRGLFRYGLNGAFNSTLGSSATVYSQEELAQRINANSYDFDLYNQIIANLKDKYVDTSKVDDKKLFEGSLKGMVDSVGDKATNYFTAEEYKDYLGSFSGQFEGIGVRLEYQNNQVAVLEVIKGSPAEQTGVKAGYVFYKVEKEDVSSSTIEDVVAKVRGTAGTKVKVTFIDPDSRETVEKEITRASIKIESMRLIEKNSDTVVFEVSRFTEEKLDDWKAVWDSNVKQIQSKGYKNIVIDLRGNGGGYLDAAIYASSDFLDANKLIVTEKSKIRGDINTTSKGNPRLKDRKVVILVNGGTASASEIFAGALRYHNGYKILGSKTFGKGTVQNTYNLPDGGALKITTEYWLMPDGKKLDNENPISPDTTLQPDAEQLKQGKDSILEEAMKLF